MVAVTARAKKIVSTYGIFSQGLENEFEAAMVNEPSLFESLKFYCILDRAVKLKIKSLSVLSVFSISICKYMTSRLAVFQAMDVQHVKTHQMHSCRMSEVIKQCRY